MEGNEIRTALIRELVWNDRCVVVWGGMRPGGLVTVHLPHELIPQLQTWGSTARCMPNAGLCMTWTWAFGARDWVGATLCRRCFDHEKVKPKGKYRPVEGWYAYTKRPVEERILVNHFPDEEKRREAVVRKLLLLRFDDFASSGDDGSQPSRFVEV